MDFWRFFHNQAMERIPMRSGSVVQGRLSALHETRSYSDGFSLVETLVTMAIMLIVAAISIPLIGNAMSGYKLKSAVVTVTGAIQATRYRAISSGYKYAIAFNSTNLTYQVQSDPTNSGTFSNVGSAVPLSSSTSKPTLNQDTTFQFRPSGVVSATTGAMSLNLSLGGKTETITVLPYGNIDVTP
jgi:prepilin-type N-terminal cleavage/methylation domain-containing protein